MRSTIRYHLNDVSSFKKRLLAWAQQFQEVLWLDSNEHTDTYGEFDTLLACEAEKSLVCDVPGAFPRLKEFRSGVQDWIFGYLSYDLKNDIEYLQSGGHDLLGFPGLYFFQARRIIKIKGQTAEFIYLEDYRGHMDSDFENIKSYSTNEHYSTPSSARIKLRTSKEEYYQNVRALLRHIHRGNIYEVNYCQEFYAKNSQIDPLSVYMRLNELSKTPFAAFMRLGNRYALSASPERFLRKRHLKLISQPIKGTAPRSDDFIIDHQLMNDLLTDPKERAENIMIADLVRNDLSKNAVKGSVIVKELCKVYTFEQVHQMISTIEARVSDRTDPVDILRDAFPMGSMTGAPKVSAMELIEEYETSLRGLYSGAIGYFNTERDFDFNVVIRSILYNRKNDYLSFTVGSAITAKSIPEKEYQECLIKAKALRNVLEEHASIFEELISKPEG